MTAMAIEKFAQAIPLKMEQIFVWYLEQKGVENPQRFIAQKANNPFSANIQNNSTNLINQNQPIDTTGILQQTPEVNYGQ